MSTWWLISNWVILWHQSWENKNYVWFKIILKISQDSCCGPGADLPSLAHRCSGNCRVARRPSPQRPAPCAGAAGSTEVGATGPSHQRGRPLAKPGGLWSTANRSSGRKRKEGEGVKIAFRSFGALRRSQVRDFAGTSRYSRNSRLAFQVHFFWGQYFKS